MAVYGLQADLDANKGKNVQLYVPGKTHIGKGDVFLGGVGTGVADSALNGATRVWGADRNGTANAYDAYLAGQNSAPKQAQPQYDIQAEIEKLRKAQTDAAVASLGKARDSSLSNLSREKAQIEPTYYAKRNAASTGSQLGAKNFAEFMAGRGGTTAGSNMQAELSRGGALQGELGSLGRDEANAFVENSRRVTDVNNAYNSDVASAEAGAMATALQNTINQYNQDRAYQQSVDQFAKQFGLQEAGVTGKYNGSDTMAAQQAALAKAIQEAGLTGMYNGQATLPYQQYQTGIDQWNKQFESNNAQQAFENKLAEQQLALSQAKAASGGSSYRQPTQTQVKQAALSDAYDWVKSLADVGYGTQDIQQTIRDNWDQFASEGVDPAKLIDQARIIQQGTRYANGGYTPL